jgi:hypothetical protein
LKYSESDEYSMPPSFGSGERAAVVDCNSGDSGTLTTGKFPTTACCCPRQKVCIKDRVMIKGKIEQRQSIRKPLLREVYIDRFARISSLLLLADERIFPPSPENEQARGADNHLGDENVDSGAHEMGQ